MDQSLPGEPMPGDANPPARADFAADARLVLTALARMEAAIHGERVVLHRLRDGLGEMAGAIALAKATARPNEPNAASPGPVIAALLDELEHRVDAMMEIAAGGHPHLDVAAANPVAEATEPQAQPVAEATEPQIQPAEGDRVPTVSSVVSRLGRGHEDGDAGPTVEMLQAMVEALSAFAPEPEAADTEEPADPAMETPPETLAIAAAFTTTAAPVDLEMALAQAISLQGDAVFQESDLLSSFARMEAVPHLPPELGTAVVFTVPSRPEPAAVPDADIAPEPEQRAAPEPEPDPVVPAQEERSESWTIDESDTATADVMAVAAGIRAAAAAAVREPELAAVGEIVPEAEAAPVEVALQGEPEPEAAIEPEAALEAVAPTDLEPELATPVQFEPEAEPDEVAAIEVAPEFEAAEAAIDVVADDEPAMDLAAYEDVAPGDEPADEPAAVQPKPDATLPPNIYDADFDPSAFLFGADSEPEPDVAAIEHEAEAAAAEPPLEDSPMPDRPRPEADFSATESVEAAPLPPADLRPATAQSDEPTAADPPAVDVPWPIPEPPPHDPLAPLKAMSAEERIALFS